MNKVQAYIRAYHPVVHFLLLGTVLVSLTNSMSLPFLAIYLGESTQLDFAMIGLIIGAGPLAGTFGGFIGGVLSDFFGRKKLMVVSLLVSAFVFVGFVLTANPLLLLLLSILKGLSTSFFGIVSKALMADLTAEEKRFRVFSNRYLAVNLGFSIGPAVGGFLGIGGSSFTFLLTGAIYVLYCLALMVLLYFFSVRQESGSDTEKVSVFQAWKVLSRDAVLLFFIVGGILLTTVHGQMPVTLSQFLKENFRDGVKLFGLSLSIFIS